MNKLIIITRGFPFGRGEAFLENEIIFLSKHFEDIYIFSQISNSYSKYFSLDEQRKLPNNVKVFKLNSINKTVKAKQIFKFFKSPILIKEIVKILYTRKSIQEKVRSAFDYYFLSISLYDQIIKKIDFNLSNSLKENLFFYSYWNFFEPLTAYFLGRKFNGISFSRAHRADLYSNFQKNKYLPFSGFFVENLDAIFTVSNDGKFFLENKYGKSEKLQVSRLGTLRRKKPEFVFTKYLNIISVGALYEIKRIDLIIKTLENTKNKKIVWHHFGDGPQKETITELAGNLLKNKVNYTFHGFKKNNEILNFMQQGNFDFLINTSSSEGIPVSIMEAMSLGIPVIATDVGGTGEIVNNKNGHLLPSNPTIVQISDAINLYCSLSEQEKKSKRDNAYNTWEEKFNAQKNYLTFIDQILDLKKI